MITEHWSSYLGGESTYKGGFAFILVGEEFSLGLAQPTDSTILQIGWPSILGTANRFIISLKRLALLDLAQPTAILHFFICPGGFSIPKALHFLLDQRWGHNANKCRAPKTWFNPYRWRVPKFARSSGADTQQHKFSGWVLKECPVFLGLSSKGAMDSWSWTFPRPMSSSDWWPCRLTNSTSAV